MPDPEQTNIPTSLAVSVVAGVTAVQVVATMAMILPPAIAPKLAAALGVPVALLGLQISVAYFAAMLMSVLAGVTVRRLGAVRSNQCAAVLIGVSLLVMTVPILPAFAAGSFGLGLAYGMTNPAAATLMMKVASPANRNLIFSIKQTGQPLGGVVAGLMGPPVAIAFGWPWALASGAVAAFVVALAIQPLRRPFDADRTPDSPFRGAVFTDLKIVWRHMPLRLLAFAAFSLAAVQLSLMTYAVTMLVEEIGFDLVTAGAGLAVLQIAGVVGRIFWGMVADRTGKATGTLVAVQLVAVLAAAATALLAPGVQIWWAFMVLFGFGFSAVGWNGVFMAEIARMAPGGQIGSATGGALVVTFMGVMIGPLIFTALHAWLGAYTLTFGALIAMTLAGIVLIVLSRRRERIGI